MLPEQISGAIPFILRCGLHRIKSSDWRYLSDREEPQGASSSRTGQPLIPPPRDNAEVGERVCIFWMVRLFFLQVIIDANLIIQAYAIELMIALLSGFSPNADLVAESTTVWPRQFDEYERVSVLIYELWRPTNADRAGFLYYS